MLKRLPQIAGEQLLIGDNGFQVIDGNDKVIGNVPYDNVEHMELYRGEKGECLGINLRIRDYANTFWDDGNTFWPFSAENLGAITEVNSEFTLTLGERYADSPKIIFQKLQQRYEKHLQRPGTTG